jgi:hypothetical protein
MVQAKVAQSGIQLHGVDVGREVSQRRCQRRRTRGIDFLSGLPRRKSELVQDLDIRERALTELGHHGEKVHGSGGRTARQETVAGNATARKQTAHNNEKLLCSQTLHKRRT